MSQTPKKADPSWKAPRANEFFDTNSPATYLRQYIESLRESVSSIPEETLNRVLALLQTVIAEGKRVFVAGNGGSAAIADHLTCDWTKGTTVVGLPYLMTQSLVSNTPLVTAIANDFGYDRTVEAQLRMLASEGDCVALISSSGDSPNIVQGAKAAREMKLRTMGFVGFAGGELQDLVDIPIHVPCANYGIAEDAHQVLMHVFAQYLFLARSGKVTKPLALAGKKALKP